ncbi:MAG TPA: TPM domain-containing protein [Isosphaeraceae bacterium]|nr:TPM domain-containing protein [Isosphaeraceae bacterium]
MKPILWVWAAGLVLLTSLGAGPASAQQSDIQDHARLFSPQAVQQARAALRADEKEHHRPTVIETIPALNGQPLESVALEHARASGTQGLYILISKAEEQIRVLAFKNFLGDAPRHRIVLSFENHFRSGDFDGGLKAGVEAIGETLSSAPQPAANPAGAPIGPMPAGGRRAAPQPHANPRNQGSGMAVLLIIGVVVLIAFFVIRALGRAASGSAYGGVGPKGPMPGQGYGAGPGYGGYGGRGGGFMSSLFGGLGGAIAGNWLYNQMSGGHHDYGHQSSADPNAYPTSGDSAGTDWGGTSGGDADWGGTSGDWGGGGDVAGGGDWGGGGGDWGGGGGDWGGGGGDWT